MMPAMSFAGTTKSNNIVILATSDVHCGIEQIKDSEGVITGMGYAGVANIKKNLKKKYKNVTLVDCGDAIQGGEFGTISEGKTIVEIMNKVGYEVMVPGNHEFDYGMNHYLKTIVPSLNAKTVSCTFKNASGKLVFKPYVVKKYKVGSKIKKVAFVGISTPETLTSSRPTNFQDKNGKYIYSFCQNKGKLVKAVQNAVNKANKEADYVIALSHLGNSGPCKTWTSQYVIGKVKGVDAVIDGHSHSVLNDKIRTADGKKIPRIATGTKLANVGRLIINASTGKISVKNIAAKSAGQDKATATFIAKKTAEHAETMKAVIGHADVDLITEENKGPGGTTTGYRYSRIRETNIGDFIADAFRYVAKADVAMLNGGAVRANLKKGDITYGDILKIQPFNNSLTIVEAKGSVILDALEWGARSVDGTGAENPAFIQVSGLTYKIDPTVKSTVITNGSDFGGVSGSRKVYDVKIGDKPIDPDKSYRVASQNFFLLNGGDGFVMFKNCKLLENGIMLDNQVLKTYMTEALNGTIGQEYAAPQGRIQFTAK